MNMIVKLDLTELETAITNVIERCFHNYVQATQQQPAQQPEPEFLSTSEVCRLLKIKPQSIYGKVHRGELPHYKEPGSKKLKFKRSEIMELINKGRRGTTKEKASIAEAAQVAANGKQS